MQLSPTVIAANLTFHTGGGALVPVLDSQGVEDAVGSTAFASLQTPSKDASFDVSSGKPVLVPSIEGGTADLSKLGSSIAAVLTQPAPRTITVPAKGVDPAFTTADAEKLGIKEMVSTFTTHHPYCASRVTNIHAIARIVNGAIVMPGATFSLNKFVGPRDTKRGFVLAPMIEDGLFEDSVGGGVSQFATTLYNACSSPASKTSRISRTVTTSAATRPAAKRRCRIPSRTSSFRTTNPPRSSSPRRTQERR